MVSQSALDRIFKIINHSLKTDFCIFSVTAKQNLPHFQSGDLFHSRVCLKVQSAARIIEEILFNARETAE